MSQCELKKPVLQEETLQLGVETYDVGKGPQMDHKESDVNKAE